MSMHTQDLVGRIHVGSEDNFVASTLSYIYICTWVYVCSSRVQMLFESEEGVISTGSGVRGNWCYPIWILRTEPVSSCRRAGAFNHQPIFPALSLPVLDAGFRNQKQLQAGIASIFTHPYALSQLSVPFISFLLALTWCACTYRAMPNDFLQCQTVMVGPRGIAEWLSSWRRLELNS